MKGKRFVFYFTRNNDPTVEIADYPEDDIGLLPSEMEKVLQMEIDDTLNLDWGKVWRVE